MAFLFKHLLYKLGKRMRKDPYGLTELLSPSITAMGFTVWGIEYHGNTVNAILRIFIDHENGIGVDDCSAVSHQVAGLLDVNDPIPVRYTLEVSSPGLDRPLYTLEQISQYINGTVKLQLNTLIENRKRFECQIISIENELITVHVIERVLKSKKKTTITDPIVLQIPFDYIDKANVVTQFDVK